MGGIPGRVESREAPCPVINSRLEPKGSSTPKVGVLHWLSSGVSKNSASDCREMSERK